MNGLRFLKHGKPESFRDTGRLWRRFRLDVDRTGAERRPVKHPDLMFKLGWGTVGF